MSAIFAAILEHARRQGDRPALSHKRFDGSYEATSYRQLATAAARFAGALAGWAPEGRIVPLLLAKSPACVASMLGALAAGRAFACLYPKLRPPQLEHILNAIGSPVAVLDGVGLIALRDGMIPGSAIARTRWILVHDANFGPLQERLAKELRAVARVDDWDDAATLGPVPAGAVDDRLVGCCLFTSGSTGTPKGVLIGQNDLYARACAEVRWFGLQPEDVLLCILPFSFDVGLNQLLSALAAGCELVLFESWFPRDILKAVEVKKVSGISAVPSIWLDFMAKGQKFDSQGAHASLRYLTVSGGDMSRVHLDELPGLAVKAGIFKTYGQSEDFRSTALLPTEFAGRPTSVGRPFADVKVYIVRPDGSRCNPGEQGEVVHTGLGIMHGYLDGADPQNKLRPNPFHGPDDPSPQAIFTGDLGQLDEEGYLFLAGRRDDMVKVSGNRVYPQEVRDQLLALAGVALAEVVPFKVEDQTHLAAFVVPRPAATLTPKGIQSQLAARAPNYMVPEVVLLKTEFPRTASGKPDRPVLAAEALKAFSPLPAAF